MDKPTLYLFVGYPGAGKTTVAHMLQELTGAEHIWADKERYEQFGPKYSSADSEELYSGLNEHTKNLLRAGKSVIFDTNFNYYKDRQFLRDLAAKNNAETKLIWLNTPKDIAYHRAILATQGERLFVSMSHGDFERVASHLEAPSTDEHPITLDGTALTKAQLQKALGL